ncbi:unknown [Corallococcus sp. CAG:1435]|nr:unknown [Corallococcus sp. CAG:1435]
MADALFAVLTPCRLPSLRHGGVLGRAQTAQQPCGLFVQRAQPACGKSHPCGGNTSRPLCFTCRQKHAVSTGFSANIFADVALRHALFPSAGNTQFQNGRRCQLRFFGRRPCKGHQKLASDRVRSGNFCRQRRRTPRFRQVGATRRLRQTGGKIDAQPCRRTHFAHRCGKGFCVAHQQTCGNRHKGYRQGAFPSDAAQSQKTGVFVVGKGRLRCARHSRNRLVRGNSENNFPHGRGEGLHCGNVSPRRQVVRTRRRFRHAVPLQRGRKSAPFQNRRGRFCQS